MAPAMDADDFHCSFCGKRRSEVRYLVCGPRVFICNECTVVCRQILGPRSAVESLPANPPDRGGEGPRCAFCGKAKHEVKKLISGPEIRMCDECVESAEDIIEEKTGVGTREGRS